MSDLQQKIEAFKRNVATQPVEVRMYASSRAKHHALGNSTHRTSNGLVRKIAFFAAICAASYIGTGLHQPLNENVDRPDAQQQVAPADTAQPAQAEPAPEQVDPETARTNLLREQLRYIDVAFRDGPAQTLDGTSRIILVKEAARTAHLKDVGLNWQDLYGVIHAETSWVSRDGSGHNGRASHGLAQMEGPTAKSLNVENPNDPVQAVFGAARLLKEAAAWSRAKIAKLHLGTKERAVALREGVSVYYNLSSAGRAKWDGTNADELPIETQRHILNVRDGAQVAERYSRTHSIAQQLAQWDAMVEQQRAQYAEQAPQARLAHATGSVTVAYASPSEESNDVRPRMR